MVRPESTELNPLEILGQEVQKYFDEHVYGRRKKHFKLKKIVEFDLVKKIRPDANAHAVVLDGIEEGQIGIVDNNWIRGLGELGTKFGIELHIPHWYFAKE